MQKQILSSKVTLLGLFILLAFLANAKYQQWKGAAAIEKEKNIIEQQILSLEQKNSDLSNSLSYLGSPGFKERMMRQQLNLKKDGEVVFGFSEASANTETANESKKSDTPNYEKWVSYFFGSN